MTFSIVHNAQNSCCIYASDVVPLGPHPSLLFLNCSKLSPVVSLTPKYPSTSSTVFVWALSIPGRKEYTSKSNIIIYLALSVTIQRITTFSCKKKKKSQSQSLSTLTALTKETMKVIGDWVFLSDIFRFGPARGIKNVKLKKHLNYTFRFQTRLFLEGTFDIITKST